MTGPPHRPCTSAGSGGSRLRTCIALLMRHRRRLRLIGCSVRPLSELGSRFGSSPQAMSQCRQDNGPMCKSPISTGFGPQNITVITSQESHYWNAFFDWIYKNPFSTSSKLWLLGRIIHCWKGLDEEIAAPLEL